MTVGENYETHTMSLWLMNDEGWYNEARGIAQNAVDGQDVPDPDALVEEVAEAIQTLVEDNKPDNLTGVWGDFISSSLSEIDWDSIAKEFLAEFDVDGIQEEE